MAQNDYRAEFRKLADLFRDRMRLRIAVCCAALAVGYFGIYESLDGQIQRISRNLKDAEKRQAVARDLEILRVQEEKFRRRLGPAADASEYVQYVLDGIRALPVKLIRLDPESSLTVGPYEAAVLRVEVRGDVKDLDELLNWLEANERLLRIDSMKLAPPSVREATPSLCLTLLGLKDRT
jgi:hypothetical protein